MSRDVPRAKGRFGFDEYIQHIVEFLEAIGPGAHVVAVCQPCVAVLVAAAVMAQDNNPAQPRSMTLMAGPIDTRVNPTKVNELANSKPMEWFEQNLIATRADALSRRVPAGLSRLRPARRLHVHEHRAAHQGAPRPLRSPRQWRPREGEGHQGLLRRIFRRARSRRRVLSRNRAASCSRSMRWGWAS